jgi:AraC family transcriptional regulator
MPSTQLHRTEYARRMNRVLDYIDRHLDTPLELAILADVANFSRFHFHRMFAGWMGETLGDYIRRRRLTVGAMRLASSPDLTVLDAAIQCGFGSGEAFGRAFKLQFGCTPAAWRDDTARRSAEELAAMRSQRRLRIGNVIGNADSNPDQVESNSDQNFSVASDHNEVSYQLQEEMKMKVDIMELPAAKVAYLRKIGPYGAAIGAFWDTTFNPWLSANGLSDQGCYGISHDDPSVTPVDKCRYDACVAVPDGFHPTGQASLTDLPGGRYAIAKFSGTSAEISAAWMEFFRAWLPSSGLQCDARPCFEYYPAGTRADPKTGVFACDLCIPVRAL